MRDLNLTEEMVLWAVWRLEDDAYGVTIRDHLIRKTGRRVPYGTLYSALAKLERVGYAKKSVTDPSPVRGGRSKNTYRITVYGIAALKAAAELKTTIWDRDSVLALEES
jgi:DNA-binding PadR family transcriptional regulator